MTEYLRSIINAFQDLIFIISEDGIILDYLTPNHDEELLVPKEVFLGKHYRDVTPPNVVEKTDKAFKELQKGALTAQYDYSITQDENTQWYSVVVSRIEDDQEPRFLSVVRNITARVLSERALEESEKKYRNIFENIRDVFYQTDKNGIITEISPSIERYSGYSPEEIIGTPVQNYYYHPEDRQKLIEKLKEHGEVIDFEARLKTKFDKLAYTSVNAHLLRNSAGTVTGIEGHMRDISERKKIELKLKRTNSELQTLNLQKDKLFSVIAHDLRNAVSGAVGLYDMVFEDYESITKEELFSYLKMLQRSSKSAIDLLEDLLMWSRNQFEQVDINPKDVILSELINPVIRLTEVAASEKEIEIKNLTDANLAAYADPDMLKTILRNLVSNAIKFSYPGGTITLDARKEGNAVVISIADEGVGMTKEVIGKILQKNIHYTSQGTNGEKGSGLGLDLCIDFVEKHGGTITAESEPGKGSTFIFTLPNKKPG